MVENFGRRLLRALADRYGCKTEAEIARAARAELLKRYIDKWGDLYFISGQSIVDQMRMELTELRGSDG